MKHPAPRSVDEYFDRIESTVARATLHRLRSLIRSEVPDADEVIAYGIPTYKHKGFVVSIAAFKNHCSFFPGHTVAAFVDQLKGYKIAKGTIQFPHDHQLPEDLVRAIVRVRYDENAGPA